MLNGGRNHGIRADQSLTGLATPLRAAAAEASTRHARFPCGWMLRLYCPSGGFGPRWQPSAVSVVRMQPVRTLGLHGSQTA